MPQNHVFGISDIRRRIDRTEEAVQHNKIRDSILSIYNSDPYLGRRTPSANKIKGFEPISLADTSGIGLHPGYVVIQQTRRNTAGTDYDAETEEVMPTLGGTALNAATPPRSSLADGDREAWVIVQERESGESLARIVFSALGVGAGTLENDEKAWRLCSFAVVSNRITEIYGQYVSDYLPVFVDLHQWKCIKTADNTFNVVGGDACRLVGTQPDFVGTNVNCPDSGDITITGTGSIWLKLSFTMEQYSTTNVSSGLTSGAVHYLVNYRIKGLSYVSYSFLTTPPTAGADATGDHTAGGYLWYELAQCALSSGEAQVTRQCISDTIFVPDLTEHILQESAP